MPDKPLSPLEIIPVNHALVACDGEPGAAGHPRVFLHIGKEGGTTCPYCSRRFVLDAGVMELLKLLETAEESGDVEEAERLSRLLEKKQKGAQS